MNDPILDAALACLARGWSIIPIVPGSKKPLIKWAEFQTRLPTETEVRDWLARWPGMNLALVTGAISGVVVADADGPTGLQALIDRGGMAELTPQVRTPRGGRHVYYAHPGSDVRNFARRLAELDFRGDGGYVLLPPSISAAGVAYTWLVAPDMADLAPLPAGLLDLLTAPAPPPAALTANGVDLSVLPKRTLTYLAIGAPDGQRNQELYLAAQQFHAAGIDQATARDYLVGRAQQDGLAPDEIDHAIGQGYASTRVAGPPAPPSPPPGAPVPPQPPAGAAGAAMPGPAPLPPLRPGQFFQGKSFVPRLLGVAMLARQRYLYHAGQLWYERNGVYLPDGDKVLAKAIDDALHDAWRSSHASQTVVWIQNETYRDMEQVNLHPSRLNLRNGMLDLATLALLPHDPDAYSLAQLPVVFDPTADTSVVDMFVAQVLPADTIPVFWEIVGSCFIRTRYSPKVFLLLVGPKDSGKSKVLELLAYFFGPTNIAAATFQALADNRFIASDLYAKFANIFSDLPTAEAQDAGRIKGLTGDDIISADQKYKAPLRFKNVARLIFSANSYPTVRSPDHAFFERAVVISCPNVFVPGQTADPAIMQKLTTPAALSGMLLRAIEGHLRLQANGERLSASASIDAARNEYRMEADSVIGFLESYTVADQPGQRTAVPCDTWYREYSARCRAGGRPAHSNTNFFRRMTEELTRYSLLYEYTTRYDGADPAKPIQRRCYVGRSIVRYSALDLLD